MVNLIDPYRFAVAAPPEVYLTSLSTTGTGTSRSVNAPTGLQVGDVMIMQSISGFQPTGLPSSPVGADPWVAIEGPSLISPGAGDNNWAATYSKVAKLADIGATYTINYSGSHTMLIAIAAIKNATGVVDSTQANGGQATSRTELAVVTTMPNALLLHISTARQTSGGLGMSWDRGTPLIVDFGVSGLYQQDWNTEIQATPGASTPGVTTNAAGTAASIAATCVAIQ